MSGAPEAGSAADQQQRWIKTTKGSAFFGGCIVVNAVLLGVETDADDSETTPIGWVVTDVCFTAIFFVECVMRAEAERWQWFRDAWNVLDAVIVALGCVDILFLLASGQSGDTRFLSAARMIRLLRISRLGKIFGLFRYVKELLLLVSGFMAAVRATCWSMMLFLLVLVMTALFTTRLVGQNCCEEGDTFQDPRFKEWFGTVPDTIFTLFTCATLEDWPDYARASFDASPIFALALTIFVVLSNMMLLQVVTAIVIEHVMELSTKVEMEELVRLEEQQTARLHDLFDRIDYNSDNRLTTGELNKVIEQSRTRTSVISEWSGDSLEKSRCNDSAVLLEEALRHTNMSTLDAKELFQVLDLDDNGWLSREEFLAGMAVAAVPPDANDVLIISGEVNNMGNKLRRIIDSLREINSFLQALPDPDPLSPSEPRAEPATPVSPAVGGSREVSRGYASAHAERGSALILLRGELLRATADAEARLRKQMAMVTADTRQELMQACEATERRLLTGCAPSKVAQV